MDQIGSDIQSHQYTAALLAALIMIAGLASQGGIAPFLARFSAWQKTLVLLALTQAGIGAQSYSSGVGWAVAGMRAVVPLAVVLLTHYLAPKDPEKSALDAAAVHASKDPPPVAPAPPKAPSAPLPLIVLAWAFGVCIFVSALISGCSAAQIKTEAGAEQFACVSVQNELGARGVNSPELAAFCKVSESDVEKFLIAAESIREGVEALAAAKRDAGK